MKKLRSDFLTIHQFAEVCRTTPRTIRFYEQKGLLEPSYIDPVNKYRYYNLKQSRLFLRIKLMQNFHTPLGKIKEALEGKTMSETLDEQLRTVRKDIIEREKEYAFLRKMKALLFDETDMSRFLKVETFKPRMLFCMYFKKGEYDKTRDYALKTEKEAKRLGITHKEEYFMFYNRRYYNPKNTFIEICLVMNNPRQKIDPSQLSETMYLRKLPRTHAYVYKYMGPFTYFILLYQKLNVYVDQEHLTESNIAFDYYLKYQANSNSEYDYTTKLCFPIE